MWLCCSRSTFFPCLLFVQFSCYQSAIGGQAGYCWLRGHGRRSSPALAPKQDSVFGHPRCQFRSTVMPFELLLYHKLIFAFFGFAVCSSCQNRSLFLCIVSSVSVINNNRRTQDSAKNTLNLLRQFSVRSGEGRRGLSVSFAPLPD